MSSKLHICSIKTPTTHCYDVCPHGKYHEQDSCTKLELCKIVGKRVRCRGLYQKELKELEERDGN